MSSAVYLRIFVELVVIQELRFVFFLWLAFSHLKNYNSDTKLSLILLSALHPQISTIFYFILLSDRDSERIIKLITKSKTYFHTSYTPLIATILTPIDGLISNVLLSIILMVHNFNCCWISTSCFDGIAVQLGVCFTCQHMQLHVVSAFITSLFPDMTIYL